MRVGLTLYGSLDARSGGFRYDRELVAGLRRAGDDVTVVELPWRSYPRGLLDNLSPAVARRLDVDVDVMLQDELAHPSVVLSNRRRSYPVVSVVHHLRASERRRLRPLYRRLERQYLATVDGAVCNSEATRETVTATGPLGGGDCLVAPPAGNRFDPDLDPADIESRATDGPLCIAFVGNIAPRKNLHGLVESLAAVENPWHLTIVGQTVDEDYAATVRSAIRDAGLGDRVTLAGELTDADLAATLADSHVLAVPSRYEGYGIVYLEGMSFGLPAIAAAAGGAGEVVTEGETGFLVDPDDRDGIARAVRTLASDRDRLARMSRAARRRYERQPDWDETTRRVREFLSQIADGGRQAVVSP